MLSRRENSWFPVFIAAALLALLVVLAGLQYKWLGQISDAERVRLEARLADDTKRFSEDFNRELQTAYFSFQVGSSEFAPGEVTEFSKRYEYWKRAGADPKLIREIFFLRNKEGEPPLRYDPAGAAFRKVDWGPEMKAALEQIRKSDDVAAVIREPLALVVPVFEEPQEMQHLIVRTRRMLHSESEASPPRAISLPEKYGFLVLLIDRTVVSDSILPALAAKYFSGSEGSDYRLAVRDPSGGEVFRSGPPITGKPDSTSGLFDLRPGAFSFIGRRVPEESRGEGESGKAGVVVSETFESRRVESGNGAAPGAESNSRSVDVRVVGADSPSITVFETKGEAGGGIWTLDVQHDAGSLDQFVANTRNRNLAVSFGILSLLAVSVVLIVVSSQRAKRLARNQMEFVSAVSHEFRTPLAVIYSAAENLSDGVVDDRGKIASYGTLIKREGKKLSAMVEQVLEFAGARSGRRRYEFKEIDVAELVREALRECEAQAEEAGFELEAEFGEGVPRVSGDERALIQAVQNLVSNAIKYSNGNRWVRVSVSGCGGDAVIAVEDRGIGISQEDRKHLFEPFFRSRAVQDEQISGNGLGLSIVKQVVDAHGGRIDVESEPGKGSRFEIRLSALNDH